MFYQGQHLSGNLIKTCPMEDCDSNVKHSNGKEHELMDRKKENQSYRRRI